MRYRTDRRSMHRTRRTVAFGWLRRMMLSGVVLAVALGLSAGAVPAHNGVVHKNAEEARRHAEQVPDLAKLPNTVGFPNIKGGDFKLLDHTGAVRTSRNPLGKYQLVFFGYANCKGICSVALPRMAKAVALLEAKKQIVTPLLITVDPERDTVENMAPAVRALHPRMIGLTGTEAQLAVAYKAFQVEKKVAYVDPKEGTVYTHGSFIYLLSPDGTFETLLPPILGPERIAEVVLKYIKSK